MALTTIIARLRMCSDALAEVDNWDQFFPVVLATRQELEPLLPKPYTGSNCGLPPATLFTVVEELNKLERLEISVSEFICSTLDPMLQMLDCTQYKVMAISSFEDALAALLNSDEQNRNELVRQLLLSFSALPVEEQDRLTRGPMPKKDNE